MKYDTKESGKRIQRLREKTGLTQEQAAEQLNITLSAYGKIENGMRSVSITVLVLLSEFYNVSTDYILFGRDTAEIQKRIRVILEQVHELESMI